jgi:hypothetical protein
VQFGAKKGIGNQINVPLMDEIGRLPLQNYYNSTNHTTSNAYSLTDALNQ